MTSRDSCAFTLGLRSFVTDSSWCVCEVGEEMRDQLMRIRGGAQRNAAFFSYVKRVFLGFLLSFLECLFFLPFFYYVGR